ncbi:MAG: insulinase family protein [bacterium]
MIIAFRGPKGVNKNSSVMTLLSAILGQGFSSRLFEKLRDEMGACYYVQADYGEYTDHSFLAISTGIEVGRVKEIIRAILEECCRLTKELVPTDELKKTKDYLIGNFYLKLETSDALATFYGLNEVVRGKLETPRQEELKIRSVTPQDIQKLAKEIFQNKNLNLAIVGDIKDTKGLKKVLKF